jgi:hypothetical protein
MCDTRLQEPSSSSPMSASATATTTSTTRTRRNSSAENLRDNGATHTHSDDNADAKRPRATRSTADATHVTPAKRVSVDSDDHNADVNGDDHFDAERKPMRRFATTYANKRARTSITPSKTTVTVTAAVSSTPDVFALPQRLGTSRVVTPLTSTRHSNAKAGRTARANAPATPATASATTRASATTKRTCATPVRVLVPLVASFLIRDLAGAAAHH